MSRIVSRQRRDACIRLSDIAVFDLDSAVDLICLAVERKASRLSVPAEELGPAAGLSAYPGKAADFRMPGRSSG